MALVVDPVEVDANFTGSTYLTKVDLDVSSHLDPICLGIDDGVRHPSSRNQSLRRHAADIEAVPTHEVILDQSDLHARRDQPEKYTICRGA